MTTDIRSQPEPPATADPQQSAEGLSIVKPLSRRRKGPGLIVLVDAQSKGCSIQNGIPSPFQKWAEEGYCVVEISAATHAKEGNELQQAVEALKTNEDCQFDVVGIVSYSPKLWEALSPQLKDVPQITCAAVYAESSYIDVELSEIAVPTIVHVAGKASRKLTRSISLTEYDYPGQQSAFFASPFTEHFDYATEAVSHTRNLTHLKKQMNGPYFDLEAIWDEHTYYEFEVRDVERTMNTMVQEPYVNHIPTLTGGIGRKDLTAFYRDHFIFSNPKDTELELISRTVGIDRVVDEFIFKLTHDKVVDWLFPCVPPTGKYVEIPFMAVVNIRGDRLYHEHITWDHASALRQIGCLPERVPFSGGAVKVKSTNGMNAVKESSSSSTDTSGDKDEVTLPVAGRETAVKLRDKNAVTSNKMFSNADTRPT